MKDNKVLVVDDDNSILELLDIILQENGYKVYLANSPEEALHILKETKIYVILLDLQMPTMLGTSLCKLIKGDDCLPWIAALSGDIALYNSNEFKKSGFDDFFIKPLDLDVLISAVKYAFDRLDRQTMFSKKL